MLKHVKRFEEALAIPTEARFVVVTRGEELAAARTERLVEYLKGKKLAVERVLVNRVLPKTTCPKCENRRKQELNAAKTMEKKIGLPVTVAPALGRHPAGLRELKAFRTAWYALTATRQAQDAAAALSTARGAGCPGASPLDFERPLLELEKKIDELKASPPGRSTSPPRSRSWRRRPSKLQTEIFSDLTRWQVVQLSRHPARPYFLDYVQLPLHRLLRAGRRPPLRRGPLHRRRLRPLRRPAGDADRPPEGPQHQGEHGPQLRDAAPRGLPQGAPADGAGRALRAARSSPSSTPRAPTRASAPRSAGRPRPSR